MHTPKRLIQISPGGKKAESLSGMTLLESLMHHGIFLRSDCGGKGRCGKCRVHIMADNGKSKSLKACTYKVEQDISIKIPETSLLSSYIMDKASLVFPSSFKHEVYKGKEDAYGIAVDLGTTTIAVYLCNIAERSVPASIAVKNPQAIYGDDVISRIGAISRHPENLLKLQKLVVKSIEWGIQNLLPAVDHTADGITNMVVVGNPTMIHILAGIDPKPIGLSPYQPVFYDAKQFSSDRLGFDLKAFSVQTLPQVSGFIGSDILAAALAAEFDQQPDGTLLIDIGTNGELLCKNKNNIYATSCATGPAFEGAEISCGMQATPGAITAIELDNNQTLTNISMIRHPGLKGITPSGVCGAGVINAVAQFCRKGVINPIGSFNSGRQQFCLFEGNPSMSREPVYISQKDIRSVQLGKAALFTGIEFLLTEAGLAKPEKIIVAGAFGNHLNKADIIRLGMIPETDHDRIEMAGNLAGAGAVMALCESSCFQKTAAMANTIKAIDLARNKDFQKRFIKNLNFPHAIL